MNFITIVIGIVVVIWILSKLGNSNQKNTEDKVINTNKVYKKLAEEEFNQILKGYKEELNSPGNDDKELEKIAENFETNFDLRIRLFSFFSFLNLEKKKSERFAKFEKWWSNNLINNKKIIFEKDSYRDSNITIKFDDFEVNFKQSSNTSSDEFSTPGPYDTTYYDFERKIEIKTDKIVYQLRGGNYRIDGFEPPIMPYGFSVRTFKPSSWLMKLNNFLVDFDNEKSTMIKRIESLEAEYKLNEAKEKYSV